MNLPPLPPLPDPRFDGFKRGGLLLDDGFDADQLRAYAEQYGRLCAEAELDRLQARVAELEVVLLSAATNVLSSADRCDIEHVPYRDWRPVRQQELEALRAAIDTARKAKP